MFAHHAGHLLELRVVGNEVFDVADAVNVLGSILWNFIAIIPGIAQFWQRDWRHSTNLHVKDTEQKLINFLQRFNFTS